MLKVQFESVLKNQVLIEKETLEKLIQIAKQVDEIEIKEVSTPKKRGSLRGIWKGSQISEDLFLEARRSLFSYEED
jgi:hypothetical protein